MVKSKLTQQTDQNSNFNISATTDDIMFPDQIEKEMNHLFFNLIELDPEDEEEWIFTSVLNDIASKRGSDDIALLYHEDLHSTGAIISLFLVVEVK